MRHLDSLQDFETKLNEVIKESYSILLKELDELWKNTLKSRLCNTYALEFSLKKEINAFKKVLSTDYETIQAEKEELKLEISALTFKKEEHREDSPAKESVGSEQETTYESVLDNNTSIIIKDLRDNSITSITDSNPIVEQFTTSEKDKVKENKETNHEQKEESKANVESIISKCVSESVQTPLVEVKKEPSTCEIIIPKLEEVSQPNSKKRKYSAKSSNTSKDDTKIGGEIKWPPKTVR